MENIATCRKCGITKTNKNYLFSVWNQQKHKIKNTKYNITGFSIAAYRTGFYIKELNIMFDSGISSNYSPTHIFITHMHSDHIANCLMHHAQIIHDVIYYVPVYNSFRLDRMITNGHPYNIFNEADKEIERIKVDEDRQLKGLSKIILDNDVDNNNDKDNENDENDMNNANVKNYKIVEVVDNENLEIKIKGTDYIVEIIRCYHSVMCTGYGLIEIKRKLKKEYLGLNSEEIKNLKEANIEILEIMHNPFFLYIGDTSKEILEKEKNRLIKYSTIMIECTFLYENELERADNRKHINWYHLEPFVKEQSQTTFILYHFSAKYKRNEINEFFEKINLSNVVIWNSN